MMRKPVQRLGTTTILCGLLLGSPSFGQAPAVLGVEELMQHVEQHRGMLRVEGVVSAVGADKDVFALIDTRELRECGVTTCARFKLPVRWTGEMPRVGEIVRVEGEVQEQDGKRVFVARKLESASSPGGER